MIVSNRAEEMREGLFCVGKIEVHILYLVTACRYPGCSTTGERCFRQPIPRLHDMSLEKRYREEWDLVNGMNRPRVYAQIEDEGPVN